MGMISGSRGRENFPRRPPSPLPLPRVKHQASSRRRFRQEIYYADGGRSTRYLASDDDDAEIQGVNDSPGTRRYTFEENDQLEAESSNHSLKHSHSSPGLPTSSSQDDPVVEIVPPPSVAMIGSPHRYPSLEV